MSYSLTVKEKEHWKERLELRMNKHICALCAEEPGFMEHIRKTARQRALDSLGVAKLHERLQSIEKQEKLLDQKKTKTQREILAALRRVPLAQVSEPTGYSFDHEVSKATEKQQAVHEDELLADTPRGRQILHLQMEMENLLDTVWLATSPKQIKELWGKVDEMLGNQQTTLQHEALAIEPIDDE